ncbi:MAG: carboxypeptidase-like regulatory domain-containing protein [Armatimonadota bacterium]|nr:carboxypeptidase-like regulatory domain-containing protein [Armatimonadota bacterium]MDW8024286.1 carboxypeptidase-like regulatory domain-containing protein [Armatimonadota bacterium]
MKCVALLTIQLSLLVLFLQSACIAAIVRSGTMHRSEVWRHQDSPVRVEGELRIPKGVSLTIEPGVVVEFYGSSKSPASIIVSGELRAIGSPTKPILIRGLNEEQWRNGLAVGITVTKTANPSDERATKGTAFKHCVFRHLQRPLSAEAPVYVGYCWFEDVGVNDALKFAVTIHAGVIECSRIRRCGNGALMLGEHAVARYCLIEDGEMDAVGGDAYLEHCTIRNFKRFALSAIGRSFTLFYCLIKGCGTFAALPNDEGSFPSITIEDVTIADMGGKHGWGAIHIRGKAAKHERVVRIHTRGGCNRIISPVLISDAVGGHEVIAHQIWWGTSTPDISDENLFRGNESKFDIFPVTAAEPYMQRMSHEGAVVDSDGNVVPDAMVWVHDSRTSPSSTDEHGVFRVDGSVPGVYTLHAYHPWIGHGFSTADWAFAGEVCRTMGFAKRKQQPLVISLPGKLSDARAKR